ncbi:hypothetical protein [Altererythrobacter sp. GH1-8]|uniref:hypothetical protein n=1 Tax=Altererythrobacter sp. GH1-8 TaxID=3349333 RepID=UPI00374CEB54
MSDWQKRKDGKELPGLNSGAEGWTPLKWALTAFGSHELAGKGGWPYNLSDVYFDRIEENGHWLHAATHAGRVMHDFTKLLQDGDLTAGYSLLGGGAVTPMPPDWWITTTPNLRYLTWSIDPDDPFSERQDLPCWIWIETGSLSRLLDNRYRASKGWVSLETLEQQKLEAQEQYEALSERLSSDPTTAGRPSKTEHILRLFKERVARGVVCERASWEGRAIYEADVGNPDRALAKTIEDRIRPHFNLIVRKKDSRVITNLKEVLASIDKALNGF